LVEDYSPTLKTTQIKLEIIEADSSIESEENLTEGNVVNAGNVLNGVNTKFQS
jgi:hypothetical protein